MSDRSLGSRENREMGGHYRVLMALTQATRSCFIADSPSARKSGLDRKTSLLRVVIYLQLRGPQRPKVRRKNGLLRSTRPARSLIIWRAGHLSRRLIRHRRIEEIGRKFSIRQSVLRKNVSSRLFFALLNYCVPQSILRVRGILRHRQSKLN